MALSVTNFMSISIIAPLNRIFQAWTRTWQPRNTRINWAWTLQRGLYTASNESSNRREPQRNSNVLGRHHHKQKLTGGRLSGYSIFALASWFARVDGQRINHVHDRSIGFCDILQHIYSGVHLLIPEQTQRAYVFFVFVFNGILSSFTKLTACIYRPCIREPKITPAGDSIRTATGYFISERTYDNGSGNLRRQCSSIKAEMALCSRRTRNSYHGTLKELSGSSHTAERNMRFSAGCILNLYSCQSPELHRKAQR